jgi:dTDP-glucose pyrophosphorylase
MITLTDFDEYCCTPATPVREVLARLNATDFLFQLILDEDGRLSGTITDGDIRRALLEGMTLDSPAERCMHKTPLTGQLEDRNENLRSLGTLGRHAFLPLLDDDGRVKAILIGGPRQTTIKTALVMAGGMGTRLGERTRETPKPLLKVGGKPILEHVLCGLEAGGISDVHISVHYLADQVSDFVKQRQNNAKVQIVHENEPLGTAGALGELKLPESEPILVVNGDLITDVDFMALAEFHERNGHDATIGVARYETEVPFGVIVQKDGLFERIDEKPRLSHFVAAGCYYLSSAFVSLVKPGQRMDMPGLLNAGRDLGLRIGLFPVHEYWVDVGRPTDLERADGRHREMGLKAEGER